MTEGIDYEFIFPEENKTETHIKLKNGKYTGTVFKYGKVKLLEHNDGPHLHFAFDVIQSTIMEPKKLQKDKQFTQYLFEMLLELMADSDEEIIDEIRTDDFKKSDLQ
jgi:hypothetical protein